MASVYPKKTTNKSTGRTKTTWYVGWYQDGKHRSKSVGASKTVANKLQRRIEAELETGKYEFLSQPDVVSIESSIRDFLDHTKGLRKPKTFQRYKSALEHFKTFLQEVHPNVTTVSKLNKSNLMEYQPWRRSTSVSANGSKSGSTKSPTFKTINLEMTILRVWLNRCVDRGEILQNPLTGLRPLKTTDSKNRRVLTLREFDKLIDASKAVEKENKGREGQTDLWKFLVNTGLRISELCNLQWNDIDFKRQAIVIQRKANWDPKTYGREVPFTKVSGSILRDRYDLGVSDGGYIFTAPRGGKLRQNIIRRWLMQCATVAKIKGVRGPHDLRHTFITWGLTEFGIDLPTMQKIAGHKDLAITQLYVHPTTDHLKQSMLRFGS